MAFLKTATDYQRPAPLVEGPFKTRADARAFYGAFVDDLRAIRDEIELEGFLMDMGSEIAQFRAELTFWWEGDGGDFIGMGKEIERARQRCSIQW